MSNQSFVGWDTEDHLNTFDFWNPMTDFYFNYVYGSFAEQNYLKEAINDSQKKNILDVGCATGTTYRFLKSNNAFPRLEYSGLDLSSTAVNKAKKLYPEGNFVKKDQEPLKDYLKKTYDVVYSRDTIMHQEDPLTFLDGLMKSANETLIVRTRTRDKGATCFDFTQSCQMHYDKFWMPYIVLNIDELISAIKKDPRVCEIKVNRSYEVLGGLNYRFLPKELYLTEAGGAETAIMIKFNPSKSKNDPEIIWDKSLEGHNLLRSQKIKRGILSLLNKFTP